MPRPDRERVQPPAGRRLPSGNWRTEIDAATWQWLQGLRLQGESISDCIIRIVIIALHKRGLQQRGPALASLDMSALRRPNGG